MAFILRDNRLSRARRTIENAFGLLSARFRFLLGTIELPPEKVDIAVKAACILHNFLLSLSGQKVISFQI